MAGVGEQDIHTHKISRYQLTIVLILYIDNVSFTNECIVS